MQAIIHVGPKSLMAPSRSAMKTAVIAYGPVGPVNQSRPSDPYAITAVFMADLEGAIKDFGPTWMMACTLLLQ